MIPIKTQKEVEKMRAACAAASSIMERVAATIRPGITTGEVDRAARDFMAEAGVSSAFLGYRKFPGHICISTNGRAAFLAALSRLARCE